MSVTLDETDRRIIELLLEDGRRSSAEIARFTGHGSERSVRYRIQRLIRHGIIRVSAIVNPTALGYTVTGDVILEVAPGRLREVAERMARFENVSYVAGSVGDGDLSIQVYARSNEELLRFVDEVVGKVEGVTKTRTVLVPWKIKDNYQWHVPGEQMKELATTGGSMR